MHYLSKQLGEVGRLRPVHKHYCSKTKAILLCMICWADSEMLTSGLEWKDVVSRVNLGFLRFHSCVKKKKEIKIEHPAKHPLYSDFDLQQHHLLRFKLPMVVNTRTSFFFLIWQIHWLTYQMWRINQYGNKSVWVDNSNHKDTRLSQRHKYAKHGIITQYLCTMSMFNVFGD